MVVEHRKIRSAIVSKALHAGRETFENYQILADRTLEFDDREVARCALRERGFDEPESGPGFGT